MQSTFPASVAVLRACELTMHNKDNEAVSILQDAIKQTPCRDLYLLLIQTLLNQSMIKSFCSLLERYADALSIITSCPGDLLQTPAIRSLFFALCRHVQDQKQIDACALWLFFIVGLSNRWLLRLHHFRKHSKLMSFRPQLPIFLIHISTILLVHNCVLYWNILYWMHNIELKWCHVLFWLLLTLIRKKPYDWRHNFLKWGSWKT